MKKILAALLLFAIQAHAQYVTDFKKSADAFYAKGDYYSAAQYYEKYLQQRKKPDGKGFDPYTVKATNAAKKAKASDKEKLSDQDIVYRIAESYRKLNDYGNAEKWYAQAATYDKATYPLATLWYGVSLRANGKYADAQKQFEAFLKSYTVKDAYAQQGKTELENCKFIQEQLARKDLDAYKVQKMSNANGQGATYAAAWAKNTLVFTSTRADSTNAAAKKNPYINNLYQWNADSNAVQKLAVSTAANTEQGAACFSADGNRMYFTRWTKQAGKNVASIYKSDKSNGTWSEPVKLSAHVNADGASTKQPFVTADGKYLFFSSDKTGTLGGFDLWYVAISTDGDAFDNAVNLGNTINTKEDDEAPFYHAASSTLVFATNGRVGMGGFDLFASKGTIGKGFQQPVNLGYPVNSIKDDSYFTSDGKAQLLKDAIISTDRSSACCLELFTVNKIYKKYIVGTITDCKTNQPLTGAEIKVNEASTGKTVLVSQSTGRDGSYLFEIDAYHPLTLAASKTDYTGASLSFDKPTDADADTLYNVALCLAPVEKVVVPDTPIVATEPKDEQVALFDFAKYSLTKETGSVLDTLAAILKREKSLGLEILGYTDAVGSTEYNLKLSQQRADACRDYLVKHGVSASKLKSTGKGECCPLKPDTIDGRDNPEGRKANRRVEFKIYFTKG